MAGGSWVINKKISSIILAGGKSQRMGTLKPFVNWKGKPLIEWVLLAIKPISDQIIISANTGDFHAYKANLVEDHYRDIGPIAGIESGLRAAIFDTVVIVSCDTPGIRTSMIRFLIENHDPFDISLALHKGINEPLTGVYNRSLHNFIETEIKKGNTKPPAIIRKTNWQEIDIHPGLDFYTEELFLNMNSPDDLKCFQNGNDTP